MSLIRDQAVVLSRIDYSETSQIVVFFTRGHGKVRAIAKGIKRGTKTRHAVGIDLLEMGEVVVSHRQDRAAKLATVTEWKQGGSAWGLRQRLERIHAGQYMAEITAQLTEDWDPHEALFDALVGTLSDLCEAIESLPFVVRLQRSLLEEIGSAPGFDTCVRCARSEELHHFSSFEGGMLCRHCEPGHVEKREMPPRALQLLRDRLEKRTKDDTAWVGAFDVLDYHITHLMGRRPKLADHIVPRERRGLIE